MGAGNNDVQVNGGGTATVVPGYFGAPGIVKFIIDKIVLPSALSSTGSEDPGSADFTPEESKHFGYGERAKAKNRILTGKDVPGDFQIAGVIPPPKTDVPPMWYRDP